MPTSFDTVEELALTTVNDYKLLKLYNKSQEGFKKWCDAFLISAVPKFYECYQDLSYDLSKREFEADLTNLEISILADFWIKEWMNREVQNSTQMENKLNINSSFTSHSAAQNLKERKDFLNGLREKAHQRITEYQLQNLDKIQF